MKAAWLLVVVGVLIVGCQSENAGTGAEPSSSTSTSASAGTPGQASQVKPGMSMADVKKIMGAPKSTRHDHGPNNSELDFWVYDDITVKFQDGKVAE
jgi:outer membrane protein assembly factor BamE (lipoprotein component of BamABCDE complex)